jgi:pantoate--beta-alanine ligase
MQILRDIDSVRSFILEQKRSKRKVGLVPTMGALHAGHLSLVSRSIQENDISIASIFVNPIQFNNPADLEKYPRTLDQDVELLNRVGCHAVFCPSAKDMYTTASSITLDFGKLDKVLEGEFRPGHFSGVGVVVAKLFNIIQPDVAYFGQKDYQQYLVISQLVQDLSFPVRLVCGEIIREENGLAMSSRNKRLSDEERKNAALLFRSLSQVKERLGHTSIESIRQEIKGTLFISNIRLEYLELADRSNLTLLKQYDPSTPAILLMAAYVGEIRLIDNIFV